jgi:hypothetical protein
MARSLLLLRNYLTIPVALQDHYLLLLFFLHCLGLVEKVSILEADVDRVGMERVDSVGPTRFNTISHRCSLVEEVLEEVIASGRVSVGSAMWLLHRFVSGLGCE